ncbi:unnamed protein product [Cyclocybe aegerita]|uniref:Uncharacterized protein n=1 Tax=Cyclocybe aegerita TaxID=1973307 RepID=A0A8S0XZM9_CYCAE|nr:unnamed protein product [Cyclocybe aegerita]
MSFSSLLHLWSSLRGFLSIVYPSSGLPVSERCPQAPRPLSQDLMLALLSPLHFLCSSSICGQDASLTGPEGDVLDYNALPDSHPPTSPGPSCSTTSRRHARLPPLGPGMRIRHPIPIVDWTPSSCP